MEVRHLPAAFGSDIDAGLIEALPKRAGRSVIGHKARVGDDAAGVVVGGGSDHMQKIGSFRSVNPYNPFLGMWATVSRQARQKEAAPAS